MDAFQAIVLGIVQGLTEFLPISSTAHLRIVPAFLGWEDPGAAFTAIVQLGTMAAVLVFFWRDLGRIGLAWLRSLADPGARRHHDARLGWYILLGTIPIGVFGLVFSDQIETGARSLWLIGVMLIVLALFLGHADASSPQRRGVEDLDRRDGVIIGLAQALALIPGVSRSGATITAGRFLGLNREAAARYSFLLSVPAVVLSGLFELRKVINGTEATDTSAGALVIATALAFVTGYASIAFLLRYLTTHSVRVFVIYRLVLGVIVLALTAAGLLS